MVDAAAAVDLDLHRFERAVEHARRRRPAEAYALWCEALERASAPLLENELRRVAADHATTGLVLDLRDLEFMDSTGLRLIVIADERARAAGHSFTLVRGRPDVHRVFEITRMVDRLTIVDDPSEAGA